MKDNKNERDELPLHTEVGKDKELDPGIPSHIVNQFAGDSKNELRELELANQHLAQDEIAQIDENS